MARPWPLAAARGHDRLAALDHVPGDLLVDDDPQDVAGFGHVGETEDHHGRRRPGLLDALALVVLERADLAVRRAHDDRVADAQRAGLDERGCDRATALVELGLDDGARPRAAWGSP